MRLLITILLFFSLLGTEAQDPCMPQKPEMETQDNVLFYDLASFIDDGSERRMNAKLVNFYRESSNQIAIVITDDLCGYELAQYATRLGHDWGLGREKEDNGVVILMRPKRDGQKGEIFIATGYGMEGPIPDAYANRITDNIMIPYFKEDKYVQGLEEGLQVVMDLAVGEYNEKVAVVQGEGQGKVVSLFMIFVLILLALMAYSYHRRVQNYAQVNNLAYWTAFFMLMNQHGHTGRFDDFNRGSGPFRRMGRGSGGFGGGSFGGFGGGSSGGGFGGFGGGGFGGGGAGGSW